MARRNRDALMSKQCFTDFDYGLPIADTPAPLPCPFCGSDDHMGVIIKNDPSITAVVECGNCGIDGPMTGFDEERPFTSYHELVKEAARLWNERPEIEPK